jgi:hypothetical protein
MTRIPTSLRRRALRTIGWAVVPAVLLPLTIAAPGQAVEAELPVGLFGSQDPTYDGVTRQSLSLLAYAVEEVEPPAEAVEWLLDQQCDDGGFQGFRADTSVPCSESNGTTFSGPDTNSTSFAVVALTALGEDDAAEAAIDFLSELQNDDGGMPYFAGNASDTNSTGAVAMAVTAVGIDPDDATTDGESLYDFLDSVQLDCDAAEADRGGFAYQDGDTLYANDYATVWATVARLGNTLPIDVPTIVDASAPRLDCGDGGTDDPAEAAAGYLAGRLSANDGTIPGFSPGDTDWSSTRWAVLALAAAGFDDPAIDAAWAQLEENQETVLTDRGADSAGAIGELILTAHAAAPYMSNDVDQAAIQRQIVVGSTDTGELLDRLTATLNAAPVDEDNGSGEEENNEDDGTNGGTTPDTEATNGGTEIADTGATSVPLAAGGAAVAALGALLVIGARRFDVEEYLAA